MNKPIILLATNNKHKKMELQLIMKNIIIQTPDEIGVDFDCDETGTTFLENSLLKAKTLYKITQRPVIADDSGLCVKGLNGAPGIYSARYGMREDGIELESSERNNFLLENMKHLNGSAEREAVFVCCMSAIIDDYRCFTSQETMRGYISETPAGCGGFGYDPIFFLPEYGKAVAELDENEKNKISHRGKAAKRLSALLEGAL